jgi:glycosyltransferase involved in cell wall biosynthesis
MLDMRFVTLFLDTKNIHLTKDVGMIPYMLHKKFGYNSSIACYKNEDYSYLSTEVKGLNIDFIKRYTNISMIDGIIYLLKNASKIDVLHLFHFRNLTFIWIILYKFLNSKGIVYLKLDASRDIKAQKLKGKNIIAKIALNKCKLVSVEAKELYDYLNQHWDKKVEFIPNGFDDKNGVKLITPQEKENYIITVGRIGTKQKNNEVLMEAFSKIHDEIPSWKVKLIGPVEKEFKSYIDIYFNKYPALKDKVIFTDAIYDKEQLNNEYRKAKVFCLTSRWEGFPLVFLEAIKNGCYIISSDVAAAHDVTDDGKYGDIFKVEDTDKLSNLLLKNCMESEKMNIMYSQIQEFAYKNYTWQSICDKIFIFLNN